MKQITVESGEEWQLLRVSKLKHKSLPPCSDFYASDDGRFLAIDFRRNRTLCSIIDDQYFTHKRFPGFPDIARRGKRDEVSAQRRSDTPWQEHISGFGH